MGNRVGHAVVRPSPLPSGTADATRARTGLAAALALMVLGLVVPPLIGWRVDPSGHAALANAGWHPRIGPGTAPAVLLGLAAIRWAPALFARLRWRDALALAYVAAVGWLVALATVDGSAGIGRILARPDEYLPTARHVGDIGAMLRGFVAHIPADAVDSWPTHVAGHPPGALLFFVLLDRLGLGGGLAAGLVVVAIAASIPVAVLLALRELGAEPLARRAAPMLVFGPSAIWLAVSADAVFAAVVAWALCALARATNTRGTAWSARGFALLAGLLFGYCAFLSYGLPLAGVLGIAVLLVARTARPLVWVVVGAVAVVIAFAAAGFDWFAAYPVLRERYYAGIASERPAGYWVWGDLAALCFSAGPALGSSLALAGSRVVRKQVEASARVVVALVASASAAILLADLSFMSKAEVERIWLPFVPWLLLGTALIPARWRRGVLAVQVVLALGVQTLLTTRW